MDKEKIDKRNKPALLQKVLKYDVELSHKFVNTLLKYPSFKSFKVHSKFLEYSCNGIVWLVCWLSIFYMVGNKETYGLQVNMLMGLVLDILIVAVIKAAVRRRRPVDCTDTLVLGPDKFSFPSGHASRAFYVLIFFIFIYPIPMLFWPPLFAWAISVSVSRLILQRHYILDVVCGMILGILEALFLSLIVLSNESAMNLIKMIANDDLPGGEF